MAPLCKFYQQGTCRNGGKLYSIATSICQACKPASILQSSNMFSNRQANSSIFTANCRFEHPGANPNPFGAANNNRFNALNTGGGSSGSAFGRAASTGADGTNVYRITKDAIKIDLVDERPQWILSAYGPGRDAPEQLFGGYPREQSFEEIRLMVATSPNPQQTVRREHHIVALRSWTI
jgi:nucleoporin NUP42